MRVLSCTTTRSTTVSSRSTAGAQRCAGARGAMTSRRRPLPGRVMRSMIPRGAVTEAIGSLSGTWPSRSGSTEARKHGSIHCPTGDCEAICRKGPTPLPVISTARTSSVLSSTTRWTLRQTRLRAPPCLRACHSPSPRALIPVLSTARQGIAQQCPERGSAGAAGRRCRGRAVARPASFAAKTASRLRRISEPSSGRIARRRAPASRTLPA